MNPYLAEYDAKKATVSQVWDFLKDGDVLGVSQCANEPTAILDDMPNWIGRGKRFRMLSPMVFLPHAVFSDPRVRETFDIDVPFAMGPTRKALHEGLLSYLPGDLHNGPARWIRENGCDVFITAAAPMDEHGYFRIPLCLISEREFFDAADRVVVEVNENLPAVYGDTEIHIRDVDLIVEKTSPLPYLPKGPISATEKAIGEYVASLVNDGDCIQLGIGGIPDAAAQALMNKHDLGVHTEMLTNSIVDLVEAGVITGRKKNYNPGKIIGTFAVGEQRLYDLMDRNPSVLLQRGTTVNDPFNVAKNDNFVSVNSCISLDLTSQICSESIGSLMYSGSGGQSDMAFGASHSKNGRNIIAVASTKSRGTVSTICAQLAPGSIVTLSRNQVDYVVTEFGIAKLRGQSVRRRVEALIAIAHPDFRAELRKQAEACRLW